MDSTTQRWIKLLLLLFILLLAACTPSRPGPMAWIDYPFDGAVVRSGETVEVTGHVSALGGTSEVTLFVDGVPAGSFVPEDTTAEFAPVHFSWSPAEDGDFILELRMISTEGESGISEAVRVRVGQVVLAVEPPAEEAPPTLVITPTEPAEQPVTPTATVTAYPPITLTPTVDVPPTITPTTKPEDTTPPPVPTPYVPADGLVFGCAATQNLVWLPVEDPSGLNGYYVRLERELSPGNWDRVGNYGPIGDKQYEVGIDCGISFRWAVRAEDKAGNKSDWSAWSTFTVELD